MKTKGLTSSFVYLHHKRAHHAAAGLTTKREFVMLSPVYQQQKRTKTTAVLPAVIEAMKLRPVSNGENRQYSFNKSLVMPAILL
jgi:hypothetical protein